MGYSSCWVFPPLLYSPILSPNDISPHRSAGSCRQGGAPRSPSPQIPPRRKKETRRQRGKRRKKREKKGKERKTPPNARKALPTSHPVVETAQPRPLPFKQSGGGPCPPSSPSTSSLSTPEPSPLPPPLSLPQNNHNHRKPRGQFGVYPLLTTWARACTATSVGICTGLQPSVPHVLGKSWIFFGIFALGSVSFVLIFLSCICSV